jgi:excisionase family DNA binding protein
METTTDAGGVELLRVADAAAVLGVHPQTLRVWADDGKVASVRTPGGQRRFTRAALQAVLDGGSVS